MSNQNSQQPKTVQDQPQPVARPNEQGSFSIQAHFKIFDPKTQRVYVEGRA